MRYRRELSEHEEAIELNLIPLIDVIKIGRAHV